VIVRVARAQPEPWLLAQEDRAELEQHGGALAGDGPNPMSGYRVTALPAGLTDGFFNTVHGHGGLGAAAHGGGRRRLHHTGVGNVVWLPNGRIGLDQAEALFCDWPTEQQGCLVAHRAWPEGAVASTASWAMATYPSAAQRSLQAKTAVGLALYGFSAAQNASGPLVVTGLQGNTPASRNLVFYAVNYVDPAAAGRSRCRPSPCPTRG